MTPARLDRLESAMRVVLAFTEAFNRQDVPGLMQLMSEDCVFENTQPAPDGAVYTGQAAIRQFWQELFRQSPQGRIEIEEIFGLGKRCILRWKYHWADAAGLQRHVRGVDLFRVQDNRICEKLTYRKG
jgi:ketosteroid isomerase-like protein